MAVHCPLCNSERVRRSRFMLRDFWHVFFLHRPCRCRQCGVRFHGPVWMRITPPAADGARRNEGQD